MLTIILCLLCAGFGYLVGTRAHAPRRDKRGRFVKKQARQPLTLPTLPDLRPQHLAVIGAACVGVGLATVAPPALAPFVALAPLPLGVALGVDIITPKKSNQSWAHLPLSAAWDPSDIMWEEWHE